MQGKVPSEKSAEEVYVGIDVCKDWLDVCLHPDGRSLRVANNKDGIRRLRRTLKPVRVRLVVMEATGKYHRLVQRTLHAAGLSVAVVNPLRARLFAEACGQLAKTDRLDARLLAVLGASLQPNETPPPSLFLETLKELVRARESAVAEHVALKNRLTATQATFLKNELKRRLKALDTHVARLEKEIFRQIKDDARLTRRYDILMSIPGIGAVTAVNLLVELDELGAYSGKAVTLLAGLAPIACDTGQTSGQRTIKGGRALARRALYMSSLSAARYNPDLAIFYKRLIAKGKEAKVALTAVMRKLIVLANTLLKQDRIWSPIQPKHP